MTTPIQRRQQEAAAYGVSLLLDDGDLVMAGGQLETVSGVANLQQGLLLRIQTPWGSDRLNVSYGLDATEVFTVGLTRERAKDVLRLNLIRTMAGDPRVAAVDGVLFDDDPAYLALHPEAVGTGGRRTALAEITVAPVAVTAGQGGTTLSPISAAALAAAAAGDPGSLGAVTLLADVRW